MRMAKGQISLHPSSLKDINAGDQASFYSLTTKEIPNKLKRKRRPQNNVQFSRDFTLKTPHLPEQMSSASSLVMNKSLVLFKFFHNFRVNIIGSKKQSVG